MLTGYCSFTAGRPHFTKQYVTLIGEGNEDFKSALSAIQRIFRFMAQRFTAGELRPTVSPSLNGIQAMRLETRFVTPVEHNIFESVELTDIIDPKHILRNIIDTDKFSFTADNLVICEELVNDREEKYVSFLSPILHTVSCAPVSRVFNRFPASPAIVRVGQLIEATVTFRAVSSSGHQKMFLTGLDSLLVINRVGTNVSHNVWCPGPRN